jgi:hypothetical protein
MVKPEDRSRSRTFMISGNQQKVVRRMATDPIEDRTWHVNLFGDGVESIFRPAYNVIYRRRTRAELVHAKLYNLNLDHLYVRGSAKVATLARTRPEHPRRSEVARRHLLATKAAGDCRSFSDVPFVVVS